MEMVSHFQADSRRLQRRLQLGGLCCVGARRNFAIYLLPGEPGSDMDLSPSILRNEVLCRTLFSAYEEMHLLAWQ